MTDMTEQEALSSQYLDAQRGAIGSLLIDAPAVAGIIFHKTREEDYTGVWRNVYQVCRKLYLEGKPIDAMTVRHQMGQEYAQFLFELTQVTPTAANAEVYAELTVERAKIAKLNALGLWCVNFDEARELQNKINRIMGDRPSVRVVTAEEGLKDFYDRQSKPAKLIPWGLPKLDNAFRTELGDFIVLGGYPSAGKTAFSLQLAWEQAKDHRVGYFSLETKPEKIIDRTVAAVCGVDFGRIKGHSMTEEDWNDCALKSTAFVNRKLEIIQAGGLSVVDIQSLALSGRYEIIYIDYLQLIAPEDRRRSDVEQVTQISKDLHTMAQTTGITVCALSQLSRPQKSGEQEKSPGLHSLRQSGQIEQDADGVILLYKDEPKNPKSLRVLKIAKNKEGEAGGISYLVFDGAHQRFKESLTQISKPPKPKTEPEYKQTSFEELADPDIELPF